MAISLLDLTMFICLLASAISIVLACDRPHCIYKYKFAGFGLKIHSLKLKSIVFQIMQRE